MKNRAKCKLCNDIIESFHRHDYVLCKCGEIGIDGGMDYFKVQAKNPQNFIRLDEFDREVPVKWVESGEESRTQSKELERPQPTLQDQMKALDDMIEKYEQLPEKVMSTPVSHYDLYAFLLLFRSILRS